MAILTVKKGRKQGFTTSRTAYKIIDMLKPFDLGPKKGETANSAHKKEPLPLFAEGAFSLIGPKKIKRTHFYYRCSLSEVKKKMA